MKELSFQNEAARHKLLDVIGDLALIGKRIRGKIIAKKPGHKTNTMFHQINKNRGQINTTLSKAKPSYV